MKSERLPSSAIEKLAMKLSGGRPLICADTGHPPKLPSTAQRLPFLDLGSASADKGLTNGKEILHILWEALRALGRDEPIPWQNKRFESIVWVQKIFRDQYDEALLPVSIELHPAVMQIN